MFDEKLHREAKAIFILKCYLRLSEINQLKTLQNNILKWLIDLGEKNIELNQEENNVYYTRKFINRGNTEFYGYNLYSILENFKSKKFSKEYVLNSISNEEYGEKYFVSVDKELFDIIEDKNLDNLFRFGVRTEENKANWKTQSAFYIEKIKIEYEDKRYIEKTINENA